MGTRTRLIFIGHQTWFTLREDAVTGIDIQMMSEKKPLIKIRGLDLSWSKTKLREKLAKWGGSYGLNPSVPTGKKIQEYDRFNFERSRVFVEVHYHDDGDSIGRAELRPLSKTRGSA